MFEFGVMTALAGLWVISFTAGALAGDDAAASAAGGVVVAQPESRAAMDAPSARACSTCFA